MNAAETQPKELRLMAPHYLQGFELKLLGQWAAERQERFPHFTSWLIEVVSTEIARREFEVEPQTFALPEWTCPQLADALMGAWCFAKFPLTEAMGEWLDDVEKLIVCTTVGALEVRG